MPIKTKKNILTKHLGDNFAVDISGRSIFARTPDAILLTEQAAVFIASSIKPEEPLNFPAKNVFVSLENSYPAPCVEIAQIHQKIRNFCSKRGFNLLDLGENLSTTFLTKNQRIKEGSFIVGNQHSCLLAANQYFYWPASSLEILSILKTGNFFFSFKGIVKINLKATLNKYTTPLDVALYLIDSLGINSLAGYVLEWQGEYFRQISLEQKIAFLNFVWCLGAKTSLINESSNQISDNSEEYAFSLDIELKKTQPLLALPGSLAKIILVKEAKGIPVDQVVIAGPNGGQLFHLALISELVKNKKINKNTKCFLSPYSQDIYIKALTNGYIRNLLEAGVIILPPGIGCLSGIHQGIPADQQHILATTPNNHIGSLGNPLARVSIGSVLTCIASAIHGKISFPAIK